MKIFDAIKKISPQELKNAGVIRPARESGYICPYCGNGTGKDGDGLSVTEQAWGYNYHCFGKCGGKNYTAVDLIKEHYGLRDMGEVAAKAKEEFNLSDSFTFNENKKVSQDVGKNYDEFYKTVQNQLENFIESKGDKLRGLSLEDLREVGAGIATAADLKSVGENIPASSRCLILPYSSHRFFMRSISDNPKIKRGNTGGKKTEIYNPYKVSFDKTVFAVEGEIDCLSIHKAGFPAVALSGAGEYKILIRYLDGLKISNKSDVRIILLLDNNDGGTGQNVATKALRALKSAGYMAVNFILSPKEKYDANEYLQRNFEGLRARLTEIYRQANKEFDRIDAQIDGEQNGLKLKNYFRFNFLKEVSASAKFAERKTGFEKLDFNQIFLPGFYIIGALSALGKSTWAWQLLSQLAERGETCIYCSYEMSPLEMFSKSFCRELYRRESKDYSQKIDNPLTSADIRRGNFGGHIEKIEQVISDFEKSDYDLRLLNLQNETIDTLLEKLKKICSSTDKLVTICIDYLQILPHDKDNAKAGVDDIVRKLKVFQRENNVTFIVISSLNRMSYNAEITFSAFKESGSIEFSADVIWGLQLFFDKDESRENEELVSNKKKAIPRLIELKCLKNRNGANYSCYFKYFPHIDTFISCDESDLKKNKSSRVAK